MFLDTIPYSSYKVQNGGFWKVHILYKHSFWKRKKLCISIGFLTTLLEEKVLYRTLKGSKALRIWNP